MKTLNINITYGTGCQNKCPYCYSRHGKLRSSTRESILKNLKCIKNWQKTILKADTYNYILMGSGEISLRNPIYITDMINSIGAVIKDKIMLVTNGEIYNKALINPNVKNIAISIHKVNYTALRNYLNNLKRYYKDIKASGLDINLSLMVTTPMSYNNVFISWLEDACDYVHEFEILPIEKAQYNTLYHFTYKRLAIFLAHILKNNKIKNKLKMSTSDTSERSLYLIENRIQRLYPSDKGWIFKPLNLAKSPVIVKQNVKDYIDSNNIPNKCYTCEYMNRCVSEHPIREDDPNCIGLKLVNKVLKNVRK